ncbi:Metalloendopeptidase-like membrane protein [Hyella patelloides LEGE 07179]|uniref:Metalloendopeptidase-like membrane protein n=1 Tax=Hyella patelloides LEGE 07179 TaxID=945734 RepID=A0A563W5D0_9CYAN|nr:M23 family metallopeptidase [Hyella patelloides]VEP18874.1 Metalloendopeptidase-like membrane protein [Hyella patelloides LEGE 07179]
MRNKLGSQLKIALTTLLLSLPTSVKALEVEISPTNPQQGDTISVFITTDNPNQPPTVTFGQTNYPVFPVNNGYRALLPTSPLDASGKSTLQVTGDGTSKNLGVWLKNRSFPTQRITLSGNANRPATELELSKVAEFKKLVTPTKYWNGSFVRPNSNRVSTVYGVRRYYNGVFADDYYHKGVDYAGGYGSPIVAPAAGKVSLVGREANGFHVHGNLVGIDHGQGVVSIFMHLQDINVQEGELVRPGQRIGSSGSTGASTGPHLHWGLYVHGVAVDPVPWRFNSIE